MHVSADRLNGYVHGESLLSGNVQATQGNRQLHSDSMRYNSATGEGHAKGNVKFTSPNILLNGPSADYNFNTSSGVFYDARFALPEDTDEDRQIS